MHTEAQVRAELPDVPVRFGRNTYTGIVTGRQQTFAMVFIVTECGIVSHEVAWGTVASVLNRGAAVKF